MLDRPSALDDYVCKQLTNYQAQCAAAGRDGEAAGAASKEAGVGRPMHPDTEAMRGTILAWAARAWPSVLDALAER